MGTPSRAHYDAVVVGGGHNGLAAAAYLGRAGRSVLVLERLAHVGGAAVSARPFAGVDVRLSRFSYLVSLLPPLVVEELGLDVELVRRRVSSYTPDPDGGGPGLLVRAGVPYPREDAAWRRWDALVERLAGAVRPTLTQPLPSADAIRERAGEEAWHALVERPLGEALEAHLQDDLVRGVVLTDALIGTATHAHDPSLAQNRCFLLHVAGGPWDVPRGGMGAVTAALARAARAAGAEVATGAEVTHVGDGRVAGDGFEVRARHVLANVAPAVLDRLRGRPPQEPLPRGSQLKANVVLDRLPALRDGTDPRDAFAGTFHAGEGYARLQEAAGEAAAGRLPDPLPCETYCHTLTDPSIAPDGRHTLTLFGLHVPPDADRDAALHAALRALEPALAEPLLACVARDAHGAPCIEVATPRDLEHELALPGGHIFHRDVAWPWAQDDAEAGSWGVATDDPDLVLCGAGARRGGGVSAIPGRAAALHVLHQR